MDGGNGIDTVDYRSRTNNLTIVIDGNPNDGEIGEGDDVADTVEVVYGGSGNDAISDANGVGPTVDRSFYGFDGNDTLVSSVGADPLNGGAGQDYLYGGDGEDTLIGGPGNDTMCGGNGGDNVTYYNYALNVHAAIGTNSGNGAKNESDLIGPDVEQLAGGDGNDSLTGSNRMDVLYGGAGNDTLLGLNADDRLNGGGAMTSSAAETATTRWWPAPAKIASAAAQARRTKLHTTRAARPDASGKWPEQQRRARRERSYQHRCRNPRRRRGQRLDHRQRQRRHPARSTVTTPSAATAAPIRFSAATAPIRSSAARGPTPSTPLTAKPTQSTAATARTISCRMWDWMW